MLFRQLSAEPGPVPTQLLPESHFRSSQLVQLTWALQSLELPFLAIGGYYQTFLNHFSLASEAAFHPQGEEY